MTSFIAVPIDRKPIATRRERDVDDAILDKDFGPLPPIVTLSVPAVRLSTVGRRAFPVAGACIVPYLERFTFGHYLLTVYAYI